MSRGLDRFSTLASRLSRFPFFVFLVHLSAAALEVAYDKHILYGKREMLDT